jgi:cell division protein YceG involved in septum cleavage
MEILPIAIITLIVIVVLFVWLFREVNSWYWKINERVALQIKQNSILEEILKELKKEIK